MKILMIEDEKQLADSVKMLLERKGFEVECVYDGKTGAQYAELGVYDLLILDVMMPEMDGYQVAREVRSKRCATPILMLTAKSDLEDRIEGLNAGADYYLTKPFDTRELLACINALLRRQVSRHVHFLCHSTNTAEHLLLGDTVVFQGKGDILRHCETYELSVRILQNGTHQLGDVKKAHLPGLPAANLQAAGHFPLIGKGDEAVETMGNGGFFGRKTVCFKRERGAYFSFRKV